MVSIEAKVSRETEESYRLMKRHFNELEYTHTVVTADLVARPQE
jgi:hypothetical protein